MKTYPLLNYASCDKTIQETGIIAPHILNLSTRWKDEWYGMTMDWILEKQGGTVCTPFIWIRWGIFLSSWAIISFSRRMDLAPWCVI